MFVYVQNFSYLCKVKRKHADIDRMVMESHYLESLERESSPSMCDMERQDYINQINDLKATIKRLLDMIDTLKQTLDSVTASNKRNEELVVKLTAQVDQLQKMVKNLEDKNQRHNKEYTCFRTKGSKYSDLLVMAFNIFVFGLDELFIVTMAVLHLID